MAMEFWGVEVKAGELFVVESGVEFLLHISQASLGEAKKDKANESVYLYLHINGKKLVLGTLSSDKFPQISLDLVFDRDFELSHNWKNGSVYFTGYKVPNDGAGGSSDAEFDNEVVPAAVNHGKRKSQDVPVKPGSSEGKKVKIAEPIKDAEHDEEDGDSSDKEDDASLNDDSSDDQDMMANGGDQDDDESDEDDEESDDEDDESDDEGKEMPKMLNLMKKEKRAAESSVKTPVSNKSTKLVTPQKTEGKTSGGHVATPYPSKHVSKAPATGDQKKEQTAKPFTCKSCSRSFGSEIAVQSHTKAKHSS